MKIKKNIEFVKNDIKKYSKNPENVKLIAATKYTNAFGIIELVQNKCNHIGENKVQDLMKKKEILDNQNVDCSWHFIGNLQKNKVKYIAPFIEMIHSVNRLALAKEIDKQSKKYHRKIEILLEININNELTKEGYLLEDLYNEIEELKQLENISIKGLMTMAPYTNEVEDIKQTFSNLRNLKDELNSKYQLNLKELSMGMSNDYTIALEEGATMIRVGSKLFK